MPCPISRFRCVPLESEAARVCRATIQSTTIAEILGSLLRGLAPSRYELLSVNLDSEKFQPRNFFLACSPTSAHYSILFDKGARMLLNGL